MTDDDEKLFREMFKGPHDGGQIPELTDHLEILNVRDKLNAVMKSINQLADITSALVIEFRALRHEFEEYIERQSYDVKGKHRG